jgi:hypothetical protein
MQLLMMRANGEQRGEGGELAVLAIERRVFEMLERDVCSQAMLARELPLAVDTGRRKGIA